MVPTISIIIPTFNRSLTIINALESVFAQTYTDYEIIVVDDGSTDETAQILKQYMNRIKYIYQENSGVSSARNRGIKAASGKWVSFLDSDDIWLPDKLEHQINTLNSLGNEFGACFTDCLYVNNSKFKLSAFEEANLESPLKYGAINDPLKYHLIKLPCFFVQSMMTLKSLLQTLNGFDEKMTVSEDTDLIFRLSFVTRFCIVSEKLVLVDRTPYRDRLTQIFSDKNEKKITCVRYMYKKWLAMPELIDDNVRQLINESLLSSHYRSFLACLYGFKFSLAYKYIMQINAMGDSYIKLFSKISTRVLLKLYRVLALLLSELKHHLV